MAEEAEATRDPNPNHDGGGGGGDKKKGSPCEECGEQPWKYRCPGCLLLTCGLPCVRSHKRRTGCTGKRSRAEPVPAAQFDDNLLLSDYNLLEETKRVAESAHRMIGGFGGNCTSYVPPRLHLLRKAAWRRGIKLFFQPRGMSKREQNRSRYDQRKNRIYWTVDWRFNSTDAVLTDHEIDEHTSLLSLLEKHLIPSPWNDQLTPYRNAKLHELKLFIQKCAKTSKSPYCRFSVEKPIGPQLRGILLVEYPVIHVFLPSDSYDFEVEQRMKKPTRNEGHPGTSAGSPSIQGTEFEEEEIEEGEMTSETQVIDLKDCGSSQHRKLAQVDSGIVSRKEINHSSRQIAAVASSLEAKYSSDSLAYAQEDSKKDSSRVPRVIPQLLKDVAAHGRAVNQKVSAKFDVLERSKVFNAEVNPRKFLDDSSFDFEQEVKDAYSDFIGEMNPDDFLCYDYDFTDADGLSVTRPQLGLLHEELEEGEIANS